jgi:solute carrier family 25 (mitochondrial carnitine/acylcarnitine transporter), member 20/29
VLIGEYQSHGIRGIYQGLYSTIIFRTAFFVWWSTYELYTRLFKQHTTLSAPSINFWAGGLSAQTFWLASFPFDVIKQRVMTDSLDRETRRYKSWWGAWSEVWRREGVRGYYRGFVPCVLRAFPANAAALFMFEHTMRVME